MLRGQKQVGGGRKLYMINRMECTGCGRIHRQLTDGMVKFKQYAAEVIEDVIDGVISEGHAGAEPHDTVHRYCREGHDMDYRGLSACQGG